MPQRQVHPTAPSARHGIHRRRDAPRPSADCPPRLRVSAASSRAAASNRPATSNSSALSKQAESDWPSVISGQSLPMSSPNSSEDIDSLARRHPVDVAAHRVDLAVMRDHAVGMRERPGREGVGGEALVHQRERANEVLVVQIEVILAELVGEQHALVDDGAGRDATPDNSRTVRARCAYRSHSKSTCAGYRARRSNSSSVVIFWPRPMNTCRCTGSVGFTLSPNVELSVGTSRQPSSVMPSRLIFWAQMSRITCRQSDRAA